MSKSRIWTTTPTILKEKMDLYKIPYDAAFQTGAIQLIAMKEGKSGTSHITEEIKHEPKEILNPMIKCDRCEASYSSIVEKKIGGCPQCLSSVIS